MHGARIPDDQVARRSIDLDERASVIFEPLHVVERKSKPVKLSGGIGCLGFGRVFLEEFLEQLGAPLQELEAAVERTGLGQVDDALSAGESFPGGSLIDVRPRLPFHVGASGKCDVDGVEGNQKLVGAPQLGKWTDDTVFAVERTLANGGEQWTEETYQRASHTHFSCAAQ